jgi:hypothetical protein
MNLRELKDLSPVAVVTGIVANILSKATMDGYVPNSDAMHSASITLSGRFSSGCLCQYEVQRSSSVSTTISEGKNALYSLINVSMSILLMVALQ